MIILIALFPHCAIIFFPVLDKTIRVKKSTPRFDSSNIAGLKRKRRFAERRWRKSRTADSRIKFNDVRSLVVDEIEKKNQNYFNSMIHDCHHNQKKLLNTIDKLTGNSYYRTPTHSTANNINNFFINKIDAIRSELDVISYPNIEYSAECLNIISPTSSTELTQFLPLTECQVQKLVTSMNKTFCIFDPFNFSKVPDILTSLIPTFTAIIHCFSSGIFVESEKAAVVKPLLKKPLDVNNLNNFRPIPTHFQPHIPI